jgi:death-on-curing protein
LRDHAGLEAAIARPQAYAHYEAADLALQAAALAHGIAESQLFIDGNKRVALAAMHTFLLINGLQLHASQEERARWILDLAAPGRTADEKVRALGARLRRSTVPHPDEGDEPSG